MKAQDFRIEEYNGKFIVQRIFTHEEGCRRKKKTITEWRNVNEHGCQELWLRGYHLIVAMEPFKTLGAAEDMIAIIIKGKTHHYQPV